MVLGGIVAALDRRYVLRRSWSAPQGATASQA